MSPAERSVVEIDGHELSLSNLDKVLYPGHGFTKGELIAYYLAVAPALLVHLRDRPLTMRRYPDGVDSPSFFEKNAARTAPPWIERMEVPRRAEDRASPTIGFVTIGDRASLCWAANLAAIELHVPMWRRPEDGPLEFAVDTMVFDLDPGPGTSVVECCELALLLRVELAGRGLEAFPKTSGSKGLQLYCPLEPRRPFEPVREEAHEIAVSLERSEPLLVVSNMRRELRANKVLIDWSQNHPSKTTIAPYSLRARPTPTVSTPLSWPEVEACASSGDPALLQFEAPAVLGRLEQHGDLFVALGGLLAPRPDQSGARAPARRRGPVRKPHDGGS